MAIVFVEELYSTQPKGGAFTLNHGAFIARHVDVTNRKVQWCRSCRDKTVDNLLQPLIQLRNQGSHPIPAGPKHKLKATLPNCVLLAAFMNRKTF